MAYKNKNRVLESSSSSGTGSLTVAGVPAGAGGFITFATAGYANGDTFHGIIRHTTLAQFEVGLYTFTTGGVITRVAGNVADGSAGAGVLTNFSAGGVEITVGLGCEQSVYMDDQDAITIPGTVGNALPRLPAAGTLKLFAQNRGGRYLPRIIGPSGIDWTLQPSLFGNTIIPWFPTTGTGVALGLGTLWTARLAGTSAAKSHPAPATTNAYTSMKRAEFSTAATATGSAGEQSDLQFWRGNAAGLGGFFFSARFGIGAFSGTWRLMIGLSSLNAALAAEPGVTNHSTMLIKDSTDTNYQAYTKDATTVNKIDSGHAPTLGEVLDFTMFCPPNTATIWFRLSDAVTGTVFLDNVLRNSQLPAATTFMAMHAQIMSASGTTAKILGLNRMYCEVDL